METDSVDAIVAAWARQDPDLDTAPLEVVGRLLLCATHLRAALVEALAGVELTFGDFDVLNTLRRREDAAGTTPRELAASSLVTSGAMTARLDRLQRARLVRRTPDPHDGRGMRVHLTPAGRRMADDALRRVLAVDAAFLAPIGPAERDATAAVLRRLLRHAEEP